MLCAEDEIGMGESHAGLLILDNAAEPGKPLTDYIKGYNDWIIEIGLTPNRVDAASHIGIARDLAALLGTRVKYPETSLLPAISSATPLEIIIEDSKACPRYSGVVIKGVEVKDSPDWMQDILKAIGLNPINNIVDATNYVLHELGHPLHAFDLSQITGNKVIIKKSKAGEKFVTLDKQERNLDGTELMICNANEAMALAGVFGGLKSGISSETKDIFIESAYFDPSTVRRTARRHGLFTDASFRFERGADPNITLTAMARVANLIKEIAGGEVINPVYDEYPEPISTIKLGFEYTYLNSVAGGVIPINEVKNILTGLEFIILEEDEDGLLLEIPTFKSDVKRAIDVVEEVIRIYSFDKIPMPKQIKSIIQVDKLEHAEKIKKRISAFLIDQGFYETYMLSFVKEEDNKYFEERTAVPVLNPISSDLAEVKNNLLIPGLKAVAHNLNRRQLDVKLFNWGHIHHGEIGSLKQEFRLNLWVTGNIQPNNWTQKARKADFFYIKSLVEKLMELCGRTGYEETNHQEKYFDYGVNFMGANEKKMASFGKLDDRFLKKQDIAQEVFYADMDAKLLLKPHGTPLKYDPISKFPKVERDLAMSVPETLNYSDIRKLIEKTDNRILKKVSIFDVYKGEQVGEGLKSYAIRMEFEDKTQTLEDKTVDKVVQKIMYRLENELQVKIRS
jgi:phenylalanyl-tRNA synthetase beta chain